MYCSTRDRRAIRPSASIVSLNVPQLFEAVSMHGNDITGGNVPLPAELRNETKPSPSNGTSSNISSMSSPSHLGYLQDSVSLGGFVNTSFLRLSGKSRGSSRQNLSAKIARSTRCAGLAKRLGTVLSIGQEPE